MHPHALNIIVPLGISFYTFKTISYTIDVYTGKQEPTRNYIDYSLFVMFFPLLLAGPIMRASDLLKQILTERKFRLENFYEGCYLFTLGLFQKVVIADNLVIIINPVFNGSGYHNGAEILFTVYAYAFQIYCDFAGYSNMAMGIGRFLGFNIMANFKTPYFSTNPQDFWNRWHISLSAWLRDYVYTPIVFIKKKWNIWAPFFAIMVTFFFCGLWHGAALTFVVWGIYWGFLLVVYYLFKPLLLKIKASDGTMTGKLWYMLRIFLFFQFICAGWLLFRAGSLGQALSMFRSIVTDFHFADAMQFFRPVSVRVLVLLIFFLIHIDTYQFRRSDILAIFKYPTIIRWGVY